MTINNANLISPEMAQAQRELIDFNGTKTSVAKASNSILKFGRQQDLDIGNGFLTVRSTKAEPIYPTTNAFDRVSSSDNADIGAQLFIIGLRIVSGGGTPDVVYERVRQTITLNGQTAVVLGEPLARVSRAYVVGTQDVVGDAYIYTDTAATAGVPDDLTQVGLQVDADTNSSFSIIFTVRNGFYLFVDELGGGVLRQGAANVDFRFETRNPGSVFRSRFVFSAANGSGPSDFRLRQPIIVNPGSDIRIRAATTSNSTPVYAFFGANFAQVVSG